MYSFYSNAPPTLIVCILSLLPPQTVFSRQDYFHQLPAWRWLFAHRARAHHKPFHLHFSCRGGKQDFRPCLDVNSKLTVQRPWALWERFHGMFVRHAGAVRDPQECYSCWHPWCLRDLRSPQQGIWLYWGTSFCWLISLRSTQILHLASPPVPYEHPCANQQCNCCHHYGPWSHHRWMTRCGWSRDGSLC